MEKESQKLARELKAASDQGVLIYQGGKLASPEDIAYSLCVREKMAYMPEFIVMDEEGRLKEIWYGINAVKKQD